MKKIFNLFRSVALCLMSLAMSVAVSAQSSCYLIGGISGNLEPTVENAVALKNFELPVGECKVFNIPAGKFDFYLCNDLSDPSNSSIGAYVDMEELSMNGYGEMSVYGEVGSTYHWTLPDWDGGNVVMYYDGKDVLHIRSLPHSGALNLVGSLNGWNLGVSDYVLTETSPGSLVYSGKYVISGNVEFFLYFLSSEGWMSNISFLKLNTGELLFDGKGEAEASLTFSMAGSNAKIPGFGSEVEFVVDLNAMTARIIGGDNYAFKSLYVVGAIDQEPIAENEGYYKNWTLRETASGSDIFNGTFNIPVGKFDICLFPEFTIDGWGAQALCAGASDVELETNASGVAAGKMMLMTGKDGHWVIPDWEGGEVTITADMNSNMVEFYIPSRNKTFYLVGSMTGWNSPEVSNLSFYQNWALIETTAGSNVFENVFEMPAEDLVFRFYKGLTGWDGGGSYGPHEEDYPVDVSLTNGVYYGAILQGKGSWSIPDFPGGKMRIKIDMNTHMVSFDTVDLLPGVMEVDGIVYLKKTATEVAVAHKNGGYSGNVIIPDEIEYYGYKMQVTSIERDAFDGCHDLKSVSIPGTITGSFLARFNGCANLEVINISDGHEAYISVDGVVFNKDKTMLMYCPKGKSGNYVVPDGVTVIGNKYDGGVFGVMYDRAFENCAKLESITIPASVCDMSPDQEYKYCSNLKSFNVNENNEVYTSVDGVLMTKDKTTIMYYPAGKEGGYTVPEVVTKINPTAFCGSRLASISIHKNVSCIGSFAFQDCFSLEEINYNAKECSVESYSLDNVAYVNCPSIKAINIGNDVEKLHYGMFRRCGAVTSIEIPDNVKSIDSGVFAGDNIKTVKIGSGVTFLGGVAFESEKLSSIEVSPQNMAYTSQDGILFSKDMSILVQYPSAKEGDTYQIPESVSALMAQAFYMCSNLEFVGLSSAMTSIPYRAFSYSSSLKKIEIPSHVSLIDADAFSGCEALESITIPESVDSIAYGAFVECPKLTEIVSLNKVAPICANEYVFGYGYYPAYNEIKVYVPNGAGDSYRNNACWGKLSIIEGAVALLDIKKNIENAGIVSAPSKVEVGESVTLSAIPTEGYSFKAWTQNGVVLSEDATYTFVMALDYNIVAEFVSVANENNVEVTTIQPNEATISFAAEANAAGYVVNVYSDAELTRLVATCEYDASGNLITPQSTNISLTFDGLEMGLYYYEVIVMAETEEPGNVGILSKYTGSFEILVSGVEDTDAVKVECVPVADGVMVMYATDKKIEVYDVAGRKVSQINAVAESVFVPLNRGIYIVNIGQTVFKVKI